MTELTPIQKLDSVLESLDYRPKTIDNIQFELKSKGIDFPSTLIESIVNKLQKNEYAYEVELLVPDMLGVGAQTMFYSYKITFEGEVFKTLGSYQGLQNEKNVQLARLLQVEYEAKVNRNWMLYLTALLTFSALATIVYYCVDLYWKYGWFHFH